MTDQQHITNQFSFREGQIVAERYEILDEVGTGGLSIVYTARDLLLRRVIAIKLLNATSAEHIVRLQREARAICQLRHKNIIEVYDFFMTDGTVPVLAMEYINGESLDGRIRRLGPMSQFDACEVFEQICEAIAYAHGRQILHRDLKPGNVLLRESHDGKLEVKIIDFGIAKILNSNELYLTVSGTVLGTPSFLSPEQASGQEVDHRSDIYSFGCLMYKTLTGKSPFRGSTAADVVNAQIFQDAPSLSQGNNSIEYSEEIEKLVSRTLEKDPDNRFQSMKEIADAIASLRFVPTAKLEMHDVPSKLISESQIAKAKFLPIVFIILGLIGLFVYQKNVESERLRELEFAKKENPSSLRRTHNIILRDVRNRTWHDIEGKVSDEQLIVLSKLAPKRLDLSESSITDEQLKYLVGLPLTCLDLRGTGITNAGVQNILKIDGLQTLLLERCPAIDSRGYRELSKLKKLKILSLRDSTVSDQDLEYISKLSNLVLLYVSRSPNIGDSAIDQILKLKKLVSVRVGGTKVTTAGIEKLKSHNRLIFLGLDGLNLSDELMPKSFNQKITMLDLSQNPFTIKGLAGALNLPDLWYLNICACKNVDGNRLNHFFALGDGKVLKYTEGMPEVEFYFDPERYNDEEYRDSFEERKKLIEESVTDLLVPPEE